MSVLYYCIHKSKIPFIAITKILYWFEMLETYFFLSSRWRTLTFCSKTFLWNNIYFMESGKRYHTFFHIKAIYIKFNIVGNSKRT